MLDFNKLEELFVVIPNRIKMKLNMIRRRIYEED